MQTKVSKRGQTAIPSKIRKSFGIHENSRLEWVEEQDRIVIVPIPANPSQAAKGSLKGFLSTKGLLAERKRDRTRENRV